MRLIGKCLANRKQKIKVGNACRLWKELFYGVTQGSIFEPLISNIFLFNFLIPRIASQ